MSEEAIEVDPPQQLTPAPGIGIGESTTDQQPPNAAKPQSTLCRERMMEVIKNTQMTQDAAQNVLALVNANPDLDAQFCMLFGIRPHGMEMPRR